MSKIPKEEYHEVSYAPQESDDSDVSVQEFVVRTKPPKGGKTGRR